MKLVAYSFVGGSGPLSHGYLPLDDLTVILGPNDSGKTRLLQSFADALAAVDGRETGIPPPNNALFLEAEDDEFATSLTFHCTTYGTSLRTSTPT